MNDLVKGIVYKMKHCNYIGSTYERLIDRQWRHNADCFNPKSPIHNIELYKHLRKNKMQPEIQLLGSYFVSKKCLRYIEQEYILKYDSINNGLNCKAAYRSKADEKKYAIQYRKTHRKKQNNYNKTYYKDNKALVLLQQKEYVKKNKDRVSKKKREYYYANKDKWKTDEMKAKRKARASKRVKCPICNVEMSNGSLRRHKKRKHVHLIIQI